MVTRGVVASVGGDQTLNMSENVEEEEDKLSRELSVRLATPTQYSCNGALLFQFSLMLEKGVGVSLISTAPEELVFVSLTGIRVRYLLA